MSYNLKLSDGLLGAMLGVLPALIVDLSDVIDLPRWWVFLPAMLWAIVGWMGRHHSVWDSANQVRTSIRFYYLAILSISLFFSLAVPIFEQAASTDHTAVIDNLDELYESMPTVSAWVVFGLSLLSPVMALLEVVTASGRGYVDR